MLVYQRVYGKEEWPTLPKCSYNASLYATPLLISVCHIHVLFVGIPLYCYIVIFSINPVTIKYIAEGAFLKIEGLDLNSCLGKFFCVSDSWDYPIWYILRIYISIYPVHNFSLPTTDVRTELGWCSKYKYLAFFRLVKLSIQLLNNIEIVDLPIKHCYVS